MPANVKAAVILTAGLLVLAASIAFSAVGPTKPTPVNVTVDVPASTPFCGRVAHFPWGDHCTDGDFSWSRGY